MYINAKSEGTGAPLRIGLVNILKHVVIRLLAACAAVPPEPETDRNLRGRLSTSTLQNRTNIAMASTVWAGRSSKTVYRVLVAAVLALLLLTLNQGYFPTGWTAGDARDGAAGTLHDLCSTKIQSQDNISFIVKTGASEAFDKLPTQLQTTLSCVKNLLLVADLDFEVADRQIHDVLGNVSQAVRNNNPAFDIYHQQRRLKDGGSTLEQISSSLDAKAPGHNAAWELDKFKFLPMVYKAYTDMPDKDWYVFLEADTYFNVNNLHSWLLQLDASRTLYIGSPSFMSGTKFNHGGSGYVLSGPAMRAFASWYPQMASVWDERTAKECCGDYVLTLALKELGIEVSGAWPMLSGEPPLETPFGPALWCQPIITMHHVTPTELRDMWNFEHELEKAQVGMRIFTIQAALTLTNLCSVVCIFKTYTSTGCRRVCQKCV